MRRALGVATAAIGWAIVASARACSDDGAPAAASVTAPPKPGRIATTANPSNVTRADYVGPSACADCHPGEHARWAASLHAAMNATAGAPGAVVGDFANATLAYGDGTVTFARDGAAYTMTTRRGARTTRYRVTRTIGRRGLQEYVGVADDAAGADEVRLPFAWWPRRAGWYPQAYFDPWLGAEQPADAFEPVTEPWAERCPWCHSTYPFDVRVARSAGPLHLGHGLEEFFTPAGGAHATASPRLPVDEQVTTGISCESCHLGGRAHVAGLPIHLVPRGAAVTRVATAPLPPEATAFADERRDARVVDRTCAQCHSGPSPRYPDGGATRNSSEALDLAASPCTGIRCTDCHEPHRGAPGAGTDDSARAIAACVGCHREFASPVTVATHTAHAPASVTCLDCHMPRQVLGIDHFVRTHRISSPSDPAMLSASLPNACNLCHLDRPLAWTLDQLAATWNVHPVAPLAGVADDTPVGEEWLANSEAFMRVLAAAAYARSPTLAHDALPRLVAQLADPIAYARTWALFAVEDVLGRRVTSAEFDPRGTPAARAAQLAKFAVKLGVSLPHGK